MKFYVNKINQTIEGLKPLEYGEYYVGLFSECESKGEGHFCGYYASESYLNTTMYAYAVYKGLYLSERISDAKEFVKTFTKIYIGSHLWTQVIEAKSIEEAMVKFKKSEWRQWDLSLDENTNQI